MNEQLKRFDQELDVAHRTRNAVRHTLKDFIIDVEDEIRVLDTIIDLGKESQIRRECLSNVLDQLKKCEEIKGENNV